MIASNPTWKLSPLSPILDMMVALLTPSMVASEPTIEWFSTVSELEADTEPSPAERSSIKPGDWMVVLDQISKLDSDHSAMKVVLYDFSSCGYPFNVILICWVGNSMTSRLTLKLPELKGCISLPKLGMLQKTIVLITCGIYLSMELSSKCESKTQFDIRLMLISN